MKKTSKALFQERKIRGIPRADRPRCLARTRRGTRCQAGALLNKAGEPGRCKQHGGLSTGPRTRAGKAATKARARRQMLDRWAKMRAEGKTSVPLTEAGRERKREAARRRMRLRWRRKDALQWSAWLLRQHMDHGVRMWGNRPQIILPPYLQVLKKRGDGSFYELAEIAGFGDLRRLPDGAELTSAILNRYAPKFDLRQAAEDLRKGAEG